jgi:hypothetical protein
LIVWAIVLLLAAGAVAGLAARSWGPAPLLPLGAVLIVAPFLFVPFVLGPMVVGLAAGFAFGRVPGPTEARRRGRLLALLSVLLFALAVGPAFGSLGS